jgi:hypothetical protein
MIRNTARGRLHRADVNVVSLPEDEVQRVVASSRRRTRGVVCWGKAKRYHYFVFEGVAVARMVEVPAYNHVARQESWDCSNSRSQSMVVRIGVGVHVDVDDGDVADLCSEELKGLRDYFRHQLQNGRWRFRSVAPTSEGRVDKDSDPFSPI